MKFYFFSVPTKKIFLLIFFQYFLFLTSSSQYFGKNKVVYENFSYKILQSPHFTFYYYPPVDKSIYTIAKMAEVWYERYATLLSYRFNNTSPIIIYANDADFHQTGVLSDLIEVGVGGATEELRNRLVMPLAESFSATNHVLGHEMAHVFQFDILRNSDSTNLFSIYNLPLWMVEGMSEYLSLGSTDANTALWMRDAVMSDKLPSIDQLSSDLSFFPYRYGHSVWAFITGKWGDSIIPVLFRACAVDGFEVGVQKKLHIGVDSLTKLWHSSLKDSYRPFIDAHVWQVPGSTELLSKAKGSGKINIAPSLSPDGNKFIFLSEKSVFSIDLLLADAQSGKVIRKLASSSANEHYDALNFIESAGSWSPDGSRFCFPVFSKGNIELAIINVNTGKTEKNISFNQIGEVLNPTWSPDGKRIAFAGSNGSMFDLYIYNFNSEKTEQLTNDSFSDIQPEWSPDGSKIIFVTDRGGGFDQRVLHFGSYKFAEFDLLTKKIIVFPSLGNASKHINPKFSSDGKSIYIVADPNGVSNIFRFSPLLSQYYQVTNLATGVSGITEISPAIDISRKDDRILFSVFEKGGYSIFSLTSQGHLFNSAGDSNLYSRLPPLKRVKRDIVNNYLASPADSVVDSKSLVNKPFKSTIFLENIGGIYLGGSVSQYSSAFMGGVQLQFSDMLNQHTIYTSLQIGSRDIDFGGEILYLNRKKRIQWGTYFSHTPYASSSAFIGEDSADVNGIRVPVIIYDELVSAAFEDNLAVLVSYPLSLTRRFDLRIGYNRVNFKNTLYHRVFSNDLLLEEEKTKFPAASSIGLTQFSLAYVGDNSFFGLTDPLKGHRFRFEITGNTGSFDFVNVLADYRKYYRFKPVTLALRGFHFGRYGGDAENGTLSPLFLGNESFVRGYSIYTFDYKECKTANGGGCPVFDRLVGSKIAVFNAELRLPFTGPQEIAVLKSNRFFSTMNAFFDAGVAWRKDDPPVFKFSFSSDQRIPVFSVGLAYRINLYGSLAAEIYTVKPLQRPTKTLLTGITITQGW